MTSPPAAVGLRRRLGVVGLTLYGLGVTIGAGIYVLVGEVAGLAGAATPWAFVAAALVAGLTAMSFAELSSRLPHAAGEAVYVREGLGSPLLALLTGLGVAVTGLLVAGAVLIGSAGYLATLVPLPTWLLAILLMAALGALALWGIAESATAVAVVTVIEIGGLLVIVAVAAPAGLSGAAWPVVAAPPAEASGFLGAVLLAFFAFIGFEEMVNVAEEVKQPSRTLPRAIAAVLVLTTLLYGLLAWAALAVVGAAELAASPAPLALVFERATGLSAAPFALVGAIATINGVLVLLIMISRVLYGLARQGALPAPLGHVWPRTGTPVVATAIAVTVVLACALLLPIVTLAQAGAALMLAIYTISNIALAALKRRAPRTDGGFSVPAWWPWLAAAASAAVLASEAWRLAA